MITRIHVLAALISITAAACSRDDRRSKPDARDVARAVPLAAATASDLARELDEAERRGTWREVRARWQGQRLRWTATRHRALCAAPSACHVAAFPIQRPARHGWLPALELTRAEFARLEAACGRAERCELEFEGTLAELVVSPELPTSLRFRDVRLIAAGA